MSDAEAIWRGKSDDDVIEASSRLHEYSPEGQAIILAEAGRRNLNVAPLVAAGARLQSATRAGGGMLPRCDYCGTRILFGGKREGDLRFCNDSCRGAGLLLAVSQLVPDATVNEAVWRVHQGNCPQCGGRGPVDVRVSHRIWSAFVLTTWSNRPRISCRACGRKANVTDSLFSLALGWWAVPWGPIMTPVQIVRNVAALSSHDDDSKPSPGLERLVRLRLAAASVESPPPSQRPNGAT